MTRQCNREGRSKPVPLRAPTRVDRYSWAVPPRSGPKLRYPRRTPLRLIPARSAQDAQRPGEPERRRKAADQVAFENGWAAMLQPLDARWVMALDVWNTIEGGRAAMITPSKRRELIAAGVARGLREFDANLVIAIVQDAARRGEMPPIDPAGTAVGASLAMLKPGGRPGRSKLIAIAGTVVLSLTFFAILVAWLLSSH